MFKVAQQLEAGPGFRNHIPGPLLLFQLPCGLGRKLGFCDTKDFLRKKQNVALGELNPGSAS